jgi:hypothetical protein
MRVADGDLCDAVGERHHLDRSESPGRGAIPDLAEEACAILKALAKGARLQKVLEVGRLRASTMAVEIGLAPCLKLSFVSA